ncbi:phytanoyl-CoA dioxygenase family protein [Streptomyces sp. NPDC007189]|uniref:phytanoyl-CoA dioxygenase family protein n=1 Tax=Streptomyces sp. NPDC007189 TaxID=3154315 RepID=UPI0034550290
MSEAALCTQRYTRTGFDFFGPWAEPSEVRALQNLLDAHPPVVKNPHLAIPEISRIVAAGVIRKAVSQLIGSELWVENTFLISKPPGEMQVPPHQDGVNSRLILDPGRSVTAWLAITPATVETGCVFVAPASHRHGYLPTKTADLPGRPLTIDGPVPQDWVAALIPAGHGLLMDSRLIHYSPPNASASPRIGLNVRYVAPGGITMRDGSAPTHLTRIQ